MLVCKINHNKYRYEHVKYIIVIEITFKIANLEKPLISSSRRISEPSPQHFSLCNHYGTDLEYDTKVCAGTPYL